MLCLVCSIRTLSKRVWRECQLIQIITIHQSLLRTYLRMKYWNVKIKYQIRNNTFVHGQFIILVLFQYGVFIIILLIIAFSFSNCDTNVCRISEMKKKQQEQEQLASKYRH